MVAGPNMYLENLDEFVNDEDKIVTYKWLSLTLGVHTNIAKQMLYHFVQQQRERKGSQDLSVVYLVTGVVAGPQDTHQVLLVREQDLEEVKAGMKQVVSVHVYSVQRTRLADLSLLHTANYDLVKQNIMSISRYSGIECPAAKVRPSAALEQQQVRQDPEEPKQETKYNVTHKEEEGVVKQQPKVGAGKSKAGGKTSNSKIASMFARQAQKAQDRSPTTTTPTTTPGQPQQESKPSSGGAKKTGGISAFLTKHSNSSPTKSATAAVPAPASAQQCDDSKETQREMTEAKCSPTKKPTQAKLKTNKASTDKGKRQGQDKGKRGREEEQQSKQKRKRIMEMSDSESSSEEEMEEEEEPAPPSPPPVLTLAEDSEPDSPLPATPQGPASDVLAEGGKVKRRKLVNKTFLDDDGFLVTKKEYEYVEEEVGEEELTETPATKASPPKDQTAVAAGKEEAAGHEEVRAGGRKETAGKTTKHKAGKKGADSKKQSNITSFFTRK